MKVNVGNTVATCTNNEQISVTGFTGKLYCPDPNVFCGNLNAEGFCRRGCSARGICVNKKCECVAGWGGPDCGRKIYVRYKYISFG